MQKRPAVLLGRAWLGKQALPAFFMKGIKQTEAVNHIQGLLKERGFNLPSRHLGEPRWIIFEHRGRQLGVDPTSGVWIRESESEDWRCLAIPCNVSGAIQAVEFLTTDQS